jgi:hypothetical protein
MPFIASHYGILPHHPSALPAWPPDQAEEAPVIQLYTAPTPGDSEDDAERIVEQAQNIVTR